MAGDYVVSFEHADFVAVRHVTRVAIMETVVADATLPAGPMSADVISVSLDGDRLPTTPGVSDVWRRATLDLLPVDGGLYSAVTLATGTQPDLGGQALLMIDGAPVRFGSFGRRSPPP